MGMIHQFKYVVFLNGVLVHFRSKTIDRSQHDTMTHVHDHRFSRGIKMIVVAKRVGSWLDWVLLLTRFLPTAGDQNSLQNTGYCNMDLKEGFSLPPFEEGGNHIIQWLTIVGQPKTKVYMSERGMLLLCQSPDTTFKKPIVTMENYVKWYGVYILHPDGRVENVDPGVLGEMADRCGGIVMRDHCYHPRLLNELAKEIGGNVCWRSLEMAGGRWVSEIMDGNLPGFPNFDIPYGK